MKKRKRSDKPTKSANKSARTEYFAPSLERLKMAMVTDKPGKQVFSDKKAARVYAQGKGYKTFTFDGIKYHTSNGVAAKRKSSGTGRSRKRRRYSSGGRYGRGYGGNVSVIQGRGDYTMGSILGPIIGHGLNMLGEFTGLGGYSVNNNSLMLGGDPPKVRNVKNGEAFVVRHREYLLDVLSGGAGAPSTNFNLQNFVLQPGNVSTFPWLSDIAACFQEYEFLGVIFEYKSLSSEAVFSAASSGALGDVIMATNYNSANANYTTKQEMLESEFSSDAKPSKSILHPIECSPNLTAISNHLYVRTGPVPVGQDQRLYDHANFQIATQGCQANGATLGELWVTYEVAFYKPILAGRASGLDVLTDKFLIITPTAGAPLGSSQIQTTNGIGGTIAGRIYTFPAYVNQGNYLFMLSMQGTVAVNVVEPLMLVSGGASLTTVWATNAGANTINVVSAPVPGAGVNNANLLMAFIVTIPSNAALPIAVTFGNAGTVPGGGVGNVFGNLVVTEVNSTGT